MLGRGVFRTSPMEFFFCENTERLKASSLFYKVLNIFKLTPCFIVSIVNFEQGNTGRECCIFIVHFENIVECLVGGSLLQIYVA